MSEKGIAVTIKGGRPWGFRLGGGTNTSQPLHVSQVLSMKAMELGIQKGDNILEINNQQATTLTHDSAKKLIMSAKETLTLLLERSDSNSPALISPVAAAAAISTQAPRSLQEHSDVKPNIKIEQDTKEDQQRFEEIAKEKNLQEEKKMESVNPITGLKSSTDEVKSPSMKNLMEREMESDASSRDQVTKVIPPSVSYQAPASAQNKQPPQQAVKPSPNASNNASPLESKICYECKEKITESLYVSAAGNYYHKSHFKCAECGDLISGQTYYESKSGGICCQKCSAGVSTTICDVCKKPVTGSFITAQEKIYHEQCFKCSQCNHPLKNRQFLVYEGKIMCENCYSEEAQVTCIKCKKPIRPGESYVEVEDGPCHSDCFKCKICNKVLKSFKLQDGYAICPTHF